MTKEPTRRYHHGNLKEALVQAGADLIEEHDLDKLSLRAIAARAGVSHAAPRNHFGSMRGLLTAIAAEGFRRHARAMRQGIDPCASRVTRLHTAMEGYVHFARSHPALFALMFSSQHCDMTDPDLRAAGAESYTVLADVARDLNWDKAGCADAQQRTEAMLWSLVHGYAQLAATGLFGGPGGKVTHSIADIMPAFTYLPPGDESPDKARAAS